MKPARPSRARLYLLLSLMVFFWSFNYIAGKVALREFPPLVLLAVRTAIAGAIILPIYLWSEKGRKQTWTWKELGVLIPVGLCGVSLNQAFFVLGLSRTSVAHAGIINALPPMMVLLMASLIGMERIKTRQVLGMAIALAGVVVLQLERHSASKATLLGDFFIFLGGIAFALFTVAGKQLTARHGPVTVNTVAYVAGAIAFLPLCIWHGPAFHYAPVTAEAWSAVVYMAAFSSVAAYLIYYYALTYVAASRVSALSYLQPPLVTIMAVPLLSEPVTGSVLAGGTLALLGVWVTERR